LTSQDLVKLIARVLSPWGILVSKIIKIRQLFLNLHACPHIGGYTCIQVG